MAIIILILLQKLYRKNGAGSAACLAPIRTRQSRLKPLQGASFALPWCNPGQKRGLTGLKAAAILTRQRENAHVQPAARSQAKRKAS